MNPHSAAPPKSAGLEFLLLLEEHAETDDSPVNQQATNNGHDHSFDLDQVGVRENDGQSCGTCQYQLWE